jgi:hypothetical protein
MGDLLQPSHLILLMVIGGPFLAIHFLPTIIAAVRKVKNVGWIFAVNFFLGWTLVGWIVALIWALRDDPKYLAAYVPPPPPTYTPPPPYNVR